MTIKGEQDREEVLFNLQYHKNTKHINQAINRMRWDIHDTVEARKHPELGLAVGIINRICNLSYESSDYKEFSYNDHGQRTPRDDWRRWIYSDCPNVRAAKRQQRRFIDRNYDMDPQEFYQLVAQRSSYGWAEHYLRIV